MNIAHLTYDMRIGGTEKVIANIIESSNKKECTHQILCIEKPIGPFGQELQARGIRITSWDRTAGFDISMIRNIRSFIKTNNIDILHCHQYTPWSYGALASFGLSTKAIFTEHGRFYPDSSSSKRRFINPVLLKLTSAFTAISEATKQALVDYEFLPKHCIDVIYNGIKPLTYEATDKKKIDKLRAEHNISKSTLIIGTVARLDPIKNHTLMIDATSQLIKKGVDIHLIIVGDGEMRDAIELQIDRLNLHGNVTLTGYKTHPKNYLQLFDIFLLTSFSEGTSMTLLEALSLGLPVIVTNVGGNPEIVEHNQQGIVIDNDDLDGLTQAIEMLTNTETRRQMSQSGKARFDTYFTDKVMVEAYEQLYVKLL